MTDTDRTNIYSYRGTDFTGDLHDYLRAKGIDAIGIETMTGMLLIETETIVYNIPNFAQWASIALHIKGGMEF